jgi:hypothetical protein
MTAQATLTAAMAVTAAATLFPGGLSPTWRDQVMRATAFGYSDSVWLDSILPANAVIFSAHRANALLPRPFVTDDLAVYGSGVPDVGTRTFLLALGQGVNTLVVEHPVSDTRYQALALRCQGAVLSRASFRPATRNPFNRKGTRDLVAIAISPSACARGLPPAAVPRANDERK